MTNKTLGWAMLGAFFFFIMLFVGGAEDDSIFGVATWVWIGLTIWGAVRLINQEN